jgi:uncharacterized protein
MSTVSRRGFVSVLSMGAAAAALSPLMAMKARASAGGIPAFGRGFGALAPQLPINSAELPAALQGQAVLALPKGFEYSVISTAGQLLDDGSPVPGAHDGMAAFSASRGRTILVRNHELNTSSTPVVVAGGAPYDPVKAGGTTTLILDESGHLISHYGSLAGTERNCAGGPTPWGSWLTCEETFSLGTQRHGYVFEVPSAGSVLAPQALVAMGRFSHEAAAVDPIGGDVYLTEDRGDSVFYRFVPSEPGNLAAGGTLWALRLKEWPDSVNTATGFKSLLNQPLACDWVRITQPDPAADTVRVEGRSAGAARFSRGEGAWYGNGFIYFVATNGGELGRGQIWAYDPAASTLTLVFEAVLASELGYTDPSWTEESVAGNGGLVHAAPDNITVGPDGRLYVCEDGSGIEKVVGINHAGEVFEVLRNEISDGEFAGACFSDNGRFMFVNIQSPAVTCVVRGPWRKGQR